MKFLNSSHAIVIGAHPDDIEYGMLGTFLKYTDTRFRIIVLSGGGDFDNSTTESVLLEYLNFRRLNNNDIIFLVQATSPFTKSIDFESAYKIFVDSDSDSLLSCTIFKRFLWDKQCKPKNYDIYNRPRRQDIDGDFIENGAFYISFVKNILKSKNRISGKISIYEMEEYTSFEIDEEYDWIIAENLMKKFNLN